MTDWPNVFTLIRQYWQYCVTSDPAPSLWLTDLTCSLWFVDWQCCVISDLVPSLCLTHLRVHGWSTDGTVLLVILFLRCHWPIYVFTMFGQLTVLCHLYDQFAISVLFIDWWFVPSLWLTFLFTTVDWLTYLLLLLLPLLRLIWHICCFVVAVAKIDSPLYSGWSTDGFLYHSDQSFQPLC